MHHTASPSLQRELTAPSAYRRARLALAVLLGLAACTSDAGDPTPLRLIVDTPIELPTPTPIQTMYEATLPAAPTLTVSPPQAPDLTRIDEVFWTAKEAKSPLQLASDWGVKANTLLSLNPELDPLEKLPGGTKLLVYKLDPNHPPQSIGSPNRGKLRNGMPLPEGDAWRLRPVRRRAYGTHTTVTALVDAFEAYGERYPESPKIRVGEIAKRTGGRVSPHASHRSGRDVDIGYIFNGSDNGDDRWRYMTDRNFDAEKNWALISEILKSGHVQTIYVSRKLQKLLHREAAKSLSEQELAQMFEYPRTSESPHAKIQHWRGHHNHMHVRFRCEPGNRRCRARG
jgi:murein endopeptidase